MTVAPWCGLAGRRQSCGDSPLEPLDRIAAAVLNQRGSGPDEGTAPAPMWNVPRTDPHAVALNRLSAMP
jgi:hypothetical protein